MMATVTEGISLFFPMLNEEANIEQVVQAGLRALEGLSAQHEVIVVDDGSTDRTGAMADALAASDPRVKVVHHPGNRGYGAALRSGFAAARFPLIAFIDGDNQFDASELRLLVAKIGEADIVSGYRIVRRDPANRRLNAFLYNRLARVLFDIPVRDVNCGFKLYRREVICRVLPALQTTGALINAEMLARARQAGARVLEVGVHHYPRVAGQQTGANPAVVVRAARELVALARTLRSRPDGRA